MIKIVLIIGFLVVPYTAHCAFKTTGQVYFEEADGSWSDSYQVDIVFISGNELDSAANSNDYNRFAVYAIISWPNGGVSTIKIDRLSVYGNVDTEEDIQNRKKFNGYDNNDRYWEIKL